MEKKRIKDATLNELENFSAIADPIRELIETYWEGDLKPKGFDEFKEEYNDYEGMGEPQYDLEFKGFDSSTAGSFSIEEQLNLPNVVYNDTNQGRNPVECLIGAVLGYGMQVGEARKTKELTDKIKTTLERIVRYAEGIKEVDTEEKKEMYLKFIQDDIKMFLDFELR